MPARVRAFAFKGKIGTTARWVSQGDGLDARIRVAAALGLFHATVASQEGIAAMSNCMVVRSATFDTAGCACERVGNAAPCRIESAKDSIVSTRSRPPIKSGRTSKASGSIPNDQAQQRHGHGR